MINSKNNFLIGIALKDFDILMNEVNFFEKLLQEPKEKQENIVKKIIISEMNNFENIYKNINQKQALNEQIMIELKTNLKGEKNVTTNDEEIRSDARRIGEQFTYGIRNPQDDDVIFQNEISRSSSEIGYSNDKFDTRAYRLSSKNDKDDQRRDRITEIEQSLVIKQIVRKLSSIYHIADTNDNPKIHRYISDRSKLVSEFTYQTKNTTIN